MKTRLTLERRTTADGTAAVRYTIAHAGDAAHIILGVRLRPDQWQSDGYGWRIVGHSDKQYLTNYLRERARVLDKVLLDATLDGSIHGMTARQVRDYLAARQDGRLRTLFADYYRTFMETKTERTALIYSYTLKRMEEYDGNLGNLFLEDIDPAWLTGFVTFMRGRQKDVKNPNGTNIHLRNIRACLCAARRDGLTDGDPFAAMPIRNAETQKRDLTVDELRAVLFTPCDDELARYQDFLRLMFLLRGINIVDLCHLRKDGVHGDRLTYIRAKTRKRYDIKIEPEAWQLIAKHEGRGEYLLNVMDTNADYLHFARNLERRIKFIGAYTSEDGTLIQPFAHLTTYHIRHSFATLQINDLGEDVYVVSRGLGHQYGSKTTAIYIDFDERLADDANRRLIDWVWYGKK